MPEMPTFHDIRIWVDKGLDVLESLARAANRVAFALEATVLAGTAEEEVDKAPCRTCGCRLILITDTACNACGTPKEKKTDV